MASIASVWVWRTDLIGSVLALKELNDISDPQRPHSRETPSGVLLRQLSANRGRQNCTLLEYPILLRPHYLVFA